MKSERLSDEVKKCVSIISWTQFDHIWILVLKFMIFHENEQTYNICTILRTCRNHLVFYMNLWTIVVQRFH